MKYQFIKEHPKSFEIKHPSGTHFHVAKDALNDELVSKIQGLPKLNMADGGEVPDTSDDVSSNESDSNQPSVPLDISAAENQPEQKPLEVSAAEEPPGVIPPPETQGPKPASVPEQAPQVEAQPTSYLDQTKQSIEKLKSGVQGAAQAQASGAEQQAKVFEQQQQQMQKIIQDHNARRTVLDAENKQLTQDVINAKIDPNRVWNSTSTGGKIVASIGILLSGVGSGLSHQPNMAMKVIDDTIQRDVDAQKSELGKKESLLSVNLRKYGDLHTATMATMAQLNAITQGQIAATAAKTQSQVVQQNAKAAIAEIDMKNAPILQQMAIKQAVMEQMQAGGTNADPATLVPYMVPEHHQKAVFDEIERAQDTRRMGDTIMKSFDQAAKDNTVLRTGAGMLRTPASVLALHQSMQPTFKDLEGTVRQAAMDNTFKNITPQPGDAPGTTATKRAALEDYLKSKASAPTAKGFGIDLNKFPSTTTQSAPAIATMNGQRYQKVEGGWRKI